MVAASRFSQAREPLLERTFSQQYDRSPNEHFSQFSLRCACVPEETKERQRTTHLDDDGIKCTVNRF